MKRGVEEMNYNLAIIGCGIISKYHARAAINMPGVKLKAVADVLFDKAVELSKEFGSTPYADYMEMLEKEHIDILIIATPPFLHKNITLEAAKRGIHIMCEKPMALNVAECSEMIDATAANGVKLMVLHPNKYYNEVVRAREIIRSGIVGDLIMLEERYYFNYFKPNRPSWCFNKALAGGGVMLNIGTHTFDKIRFLTDSSVNSQQGSIGYHKDYDGIEGYGQVFFKLKNGVSAAATVNGYDNDFKAEMECICTKGKIIIKSFPGKISIYNNNTWEHEEIEQTKSHQLLMLEDFIDCIERNREPWNNGEYGREIQGIVEKLYEENANRFSLDKPLFN